MAKKINVENGAAPKEEQASGQKVSPSVFVDERSQFLSKIDFVALNRITHWVSPVNESGKTLSENEIVSKVIAHINSKEWLKDDLYKGRYLKPFFVPFEDQKLYEKLGQSKQQFKGNNLSVVERNVGTKEKPEWKLGVMTTVRASLDQNDNMKLYSTICVDYKTPDMLLLSGANLYMSPLSREELAQLWNEGHCLHTYDLGEKNKGKVYLCCINSVTGQVDGRDVKALEERMDKMIEKNLFYGVKPNEAQRRELLVGNAVSFTDKKTGEKFTLQYHPEKFTYIKNEVVESKAQQTGIVCQLSQSQQQEQSQSQQQEKSEGEAMGIPM